MEEILWLMQQCSRELQDYRQDIRNDWDDEAANELNTRYLNPHEEDDQKMRKFLRAQHRGLESAAMQLSIANQRALEADKYSLEVQYFLELTQQDVARSYQSYEQSRRDCLATQSQLELVGKFIIQANSACPS